MIKLGSFLQVLALLFLISPLLSVHVNAGESIANVSIRDRNPRTQQTADASTSASSETSKIVAPTPHQDAIAEIHGGCQMLLISALSSSPSFTRHLMCKDDTLVWLGRPRLFPLAPTTIFGPSDIKAECLTTVNISSTMEYRWHYRNSSTKSWISCFNWTDRVYTPGEWDMAGFLNIAGYWPAYNYPRAYKVDVYLDGSPASSFSEYFEVTNGGLNSPRMCENIDANGFPVNVTSRFTLGEDAEVYHYLRFDKTGYFNERDGFCHNFTTVWTQPNGSTYKTYSGNFSDYKDADLDSNFWESRYVSDDFISINSTTPFGDWKVEVYLDSYFNNTWMPYGPVAATHFVIGSAPVADWTLMVYLDADNELEAAGIDVFLKLSSIGSSPDVNVVVQMDRHPWYDPHPQLPGDERDGYDDRYDNWTDCKRFSVTKGMWPTSGNATEDLGEVNMGDPNTLWSFVNWTVSNYPAKYCLLALFDHGTGCMGICYDVTDSSNYLSLPELGQALSELPVIIDVLLLDACSMGMTEVAYQIRDYANVLVGPEGLGYAPAPYDNYLSILTNYPSTMPSDFAKQLASEYINWCMPIPEIENATMSATDLTKIVALRMAITDFSLEINETEIIYHELITLARNMTEQYPGPYAVQSGYYIDLYRLSELAYQYIPNSNVRNAADQVMGALESMIMYKGDKALPASHGLSIFFPHRNNYDDFNSYFKSPYLETGLTKDTPWDEFFINHLNLQKNGCVLTIQTPYSDISVTFNEEYYLTDVNGKLRLFVLPGSCAVEVPSQVLRGSGIRGIFTRWNDNDPNPSRTIPLSSSATYTAYYETQYEVAFNQWGVSIGYEGTILTVDGMDYNSSKLPVSFWWNQSTSHTFAYWSPLQVSAKVSRYVWSATTGLSSLRTEQITASASGSITGYYKTQFYLSLTTNPLDVATPSGEGWYYNGTDAQISTPEYVDITPTLSRYRFNNWTTEDTTKLTNLNLHSTAVRIDEAKTVTSNYLTEHYLTVISPYGSPTPTSGWFESGKLIEASIASPTSGPTGTRYLCDGWTGTGSVSTSGTTTSVNFTLNEPSSITWNWKTQYLLTVSTNPTELTPEPTVFPVGPWYDGGAQVTLTASHIEGRTFDHWTCNDASWDRDVNPITVAMDRPRNAIAHYVRASAWWEILAKPENLSLVLGLVGILITVGLIGTAWIRTRKGKATVRTFSIRIDEVCAKHKDDPRKCEEELRRLRNTAFEGVTDGRITQEGYEIIQAKIDKCLKEVARARGK